MEQKEISLEMKKEILDEYKKHNWPHDVNCECPVCTMRRDAAIRESRELDYEWRREFLDVIKGTPFEDYNMEKIWKLNGYLTELEDKARKWDDSQRPPTTIEFVCKDCEHNFYDDIQCPDCDERIITCRRCGTLHGPDDIYDRKASDNAAN